MNQRREEQEKPQQTTGTLFAWVLLSDGGTNIAVPFPLERLHGDNPHTLTSPPHPTPPRVRLLLGFRGVNESCL